MGEWAGKKWINYARLFWFDFIHAFSCPPQTNMRKKCEKSTNEIINSCWLKLLNECGKSESKYAVILNLIRFQFLRCLVFFFSPPNLAGFDCFSLFVCLIWMSLQNIWCWFPVFKKIKNECTVSKWAFHLMRGRQFHGRPIRGRIRDPVPVGGRGG